MIEILTVLVMLAGLALWCAVSWFVGNRYFSDDDNACQVLAGSLIITLILFFTIGTLTALVQTYQTVHGWLQVWI